MNNPYAGAENAVELCEKLQQWDMFRGVAVREGIPAMKERMRQALTFAMTQMGEGPRQVLQEALSEWDHPKFMVYLCGKVGAV